jgi:hypothetical protein
MNSATQVCEVAPLADTYLEGCEPEWSVHVIE